MFAFYHVPVKSDVRAPNSERNTLDPRAIADSLVSETRVVITSPVSSSDPQPSDGPLRAEEPTEPERPKELDDVHEVVLASESTDSLCISGVTEPAHGRYAKLPLATSQAVAFVDVKPGDRIKKGWQVFSHWESPERLQAMKTELEKMKKIFAVAQTRAAASKQTVERLRKVQRNVAAQEMQDAETMATIRNGELETAELAVAEVESRYVAMEFEFNQAFVTSPIDGTVVSVDVIPGERRQAGSGFRGVTILDARVLHCRCLLDQQQISFLERLASRASSQTVATQSVVPAADKQPDVRAIQPLRIHPTIESEGIDRSATIVSISLLADAKTGLIPVVLEIQNPDERLRCGVHVNVCFRAM